MKTREGRSDPGCTNYHEDSDRDGFGAPAATKYLCAPDDASDTETPDDCDDQRISVLTVL